MATTRCAATILTILLLAGAAVPPLAAQSNEVATHRLVAGGIGGMLIGAAVGGAAGWTLYRVACTDYCAIGGAVAVLGAGAGATVGSPAGVHLGNRRSGNLALSLLASAAVAAGSGAILYAIAGMVDSDAAVNASYAVGAAAVPALQIGIAVRIEQRTGRLR
jgi:hypothetical protein